MLLFPMPRLASSVSVIPALSVSRVWVVASSESGVGLNHPRLGLWCVGYLVAWVMVVLS